MSFSTPLWLLALIPLILVHGRWWRRTAQRRAFLFPVADLAAAVPASARRRLHGWRRGVSLAGSLSLLIALAGPRLDHEVSVTTGHGVDALIVLDVSSSMERVDVPESPPMEPAEAGGRTRLEIAREVVEEFIRRRASDRMGLMVFARFARPLCPLTTDHAALLATLDRVQPVEPGGDEDQTGVGVALATAVAQVAESDAASRIVVLLTDGAENVRAVSALESARYAKDRDVRVYTIAVGQGASEWSSTLVAAAKTTGGRGYIARGAGELRGIYQEIDALERTDIARAQRTLYTPLHGLAIWIGFLLLLAGPLLDEALFRRSP